MTAIKNCAFSLFSLFRCAWQLSFKINTPTEYPQDLTNFRRGLAGDLENVSAHRNVYDSSIVRQSKIILQWIL